MVLRDTTDAPMRALKIAVFLFFSVQCRFEITAGSAQESANLPQSSGSTKLSVCEAILRPPTDAPYQALPYPAKG